MLIFDRIKFVKCSNSLKLNSQFMFNQLFLDSFNALSSELQSNVVQILTHNKKVSQKIQTLCIELLAFKCELFNIIANLIKKTLSNSTQSKDQLQQMVTDISVERQRSNVKLCRYKLHQILKRKVIKKKRQSMLRSTIQPQMQQISQLQKSVILIQKDLGLQNQSDNQEDLAISAIINRSRAGLENTLMSKIGDYSIVSENQCINLEWQIQNKSKIQLTANFKQHQQKNASQSVPKQIKPAQTYPKKAQLPKRAQLPIKKKQRNKPDQKQGLLGNLLEQTYQQVLQK